MKAVVAAFNQEKALVGAFSVIMKTGCETDGSFYSTNSIVACLKCDEKCVLRSGKLLHVRVSGFISPVSPDGVVKE